MTTPGPVPRPLEGTDEPAPRAPIGEENPNGVDEAPATRREMKSQGIALTSETPVIAEPLPWLGGAAAAIHARRALAVRHDAGHAVTETGDLAEVAASSPAVWQAPPVPAEAQSGSNGSAAETMDPRGSAAAGITSDVDVASDVDAVSASALDSTVSASAADPTVSASAADPTVSASAADPTASASAADDGTEPGSPETGAPALEDGTSSATEEPASTGRRPVVLAPLTASGIRTVDESGVITGVQAAVGRAVESATSPASWESAVSLPAVALGIADVAVAPQEAEPTSPPTMARDLPVEDTAPGGTGDDATGHPGAGESSSDAAVPVRGTGDGGTGQAASAPSATGRASDASVAEVVSVAPRPRTDTRTMTIRVVVGLLVLLALVALVYLFSTGTLGSVFASDGAQGLGAAGTLAALGRPRRRRAARTACRKNRRGAS